MKINHRFIGEIAPATLLLKLALYQMQMIAKNTIIKFAFQQL
jgi:hypothetical protein